LVSKTARGGFTLIEVMVSVVIISVVGLALLDISSKNTKIISFLHTKRELPLALSIVGFHGDADLNKLEKSLLDIVDNSYNIQSQRLKAYLDQKKITYKEESVDRVDFGQNEDGESSGLTRQIEIYKQEVRLGDIFGKIYTFRLED